MRLIQLLKLVIVRIIVTILMPLVLKVLKIVLIFVLEQIKLLKYLQLSEIISIFAHRTMDVFHLLGLGCPRSEELSGSWRLFFYACWDGEILRPKSLPSSMNILGANTS